MSYNLKTLIVFEQLIVELDSIKRLSCQLTIGTIEKNRKHWLQHNIKKHRANKGFREFCALNKFSARLTEKYS